MEVLNPLAVLDVGLLTRHILNVLRVNQAHFNLALLQNLKKRNPVNASGLHRDRLNLALLKPVSQLFQIGRERVKATNWIRVAFGWNCDENLGCAYVDPSGIGLHYWQTYGLDSLLGHSFSPFCPVRRPGPCKESSLPNEIRRNLGLRKSSLY